MDEKAPCSVLRVLGDVIGFSGYYATQSKANKPLNPKPSTLSEIILCQNLFSSLQGPGEVGGDARRAEG